MMLRQTLDKFTYRLVVIFFIGNMRIQMSRTLNRMQSRSRLFMDDFFNIDKGSYGIVRTMNNQEWAIQLLDVRPKIPMPDARQPEPEHGQIRQRSGGIAGRTQPLL